MTEERSPLSVYAHLPFCARKCHYCDFNSRSGSDEQRARYIDALKREIDCRAETLGGHCVRTIFFGGGTPTVYEGEELADVLCVVRTPSSAHAPPPGATNGVAQAGRAGRKATATDCVEITCEANPETGPHPPAIDDIAFPPLPGVIDDMTQAGRGGRKATATDCVEITCEANPETVDLPKLQALREAGFNRISIGAQSFHDGELTMLGRGHTADQTEKAVRAAREAGFANVSLDLIYALPGQTVDRWRETLRRALALRPEHLSAYGLELAEGTPLFARWQRGEIAPVGEREHLAMRDLTLEMCEQAGLRRYEISNYALPGRECAHNLTYWRNEDYLGVGAGAWSYLGGVRSANLREPSDYVNAIESGDDPAA
jgi:coproporphyrinogen III oxidase-like Fe-S oxidoreductase